MRPTAKGRGTPERAGRIVKLTGPGRKSPANIALLGMVVLALAGAAYLTCSVISDTITPATSPAPSVVPPSQPATPPTGAAPAPTVSDPLALFDPTRAMEHARVLGEDIGLRGWGSAAENRGAGYIANQFEQLGYDVE
jgi:hypothetical protein